MTGRRCVLLVVIALLVGAAAVGAPVAANEAGNGAENTDTEAVGLEGIDHLVANDEELAAHVDEYRAATGAFETELDELNTTIDRIEGGNDGDLGEAEAMLERLDDRHENMTTQETELRQYLLTATSEGNATGTFDAIATINDRQEDRTAALATSTDAYVTAVEDRRSDPRSTVRMTLFGSLLGGLAVGIVAGAAVPIVAAKRVSEKMKLSRDVSYDRKVVLIPVLVGIALALAGIAVLIVLGGGAELLEVVR